MGRKICIFIKKIIGNNIPPKIIEIHPPFNDYCPTIKDFFERYQVFESIIRSYYPDVEICLENRAGSIYSSGSFLISDFDSIVETLAYIQKHDLSLRMVFDYPQFFKIYRN